MTRSAAEADRHYPDEGARSVVPTPTSRLLFVMRWLNNCTNGTRPTVSVYLNSKMRKAVNNYPLQYPRSMDQKIV
jgi:hypothetical protein